MTCGVASKSKSGQFFSIHSGSKFANLAIVADGAACHWLLLCLILIPGCNSAASEIGRSVGRGGFVAVHGAIRRPSREPTCVARCAIESETSFSPLKFLFLHSPQDQDDLEHETERTFCVSRRKAASGSVLSRNFRNFGEKSYSYNRHEVGGSKQRPGGDNSVFFGQSSRFFIWNSPPLCSGMHVCVRILVGS